MRGSRLNAVKTMTEMVTTVIESRKFLKNQVNLQGYVLVSAEALYDLHAKYAELGLVPPKWRPDNMQTEMELKEK